MPIQQQAQFKMCLLLIYDRSLLNWANDSIADFAVNDC
jgi:hypothetical protein